MGIEESFWRLVLVGDLTECWPWLGSTRGHNYGQCSKYHDSSRIAARAAFKFWYGVELGELLACHTCDNTLCCNPDHLFAGTHQENTRDAVNKGRFRLPPRHKETSAARVALADRYKDADWRRQQGKRISAGHAAKKAAQQNTVRRFAFGYGV